MADRYFPDDPIQGDSVLLTGSEAHHLLHVMRAVSGTRVVLFDGSGAEFEAEVCRAGRSEVELSVLARREVDRELPVEITLGTALPKGDRQRWLVEKAVELGVARLVPLRTARSVAGPGSKALDRLRRTVIEASKQCGRNRLMEIGVADDWETWIEDADAATLRLLAHPGGEGTGDLFRERPEGRGPEGLRGAVFLSVGPEGGLTEQEVDRAKVAGWQPVDLGPRILRIETAAVLLVALAAGRIPTGR